MFVHLIRATLKPNAWDKAEAQFRRWQREQAPKVSGFKGDYLLPRERRA
jgi:hypothetical protein